MPVEAVIMRHVRIPMRTPFVTSYGVQSQKDAIILEVHTKEGGIGFAECCALSVPLYTEETTATAWHVIHDFLLPMVWRLSLDHAGDLLRIRDVIAPVRGNRMAKAAVEMALWDAYAQVHSVPLPRLLGGVREEVEVGVSLGIQSDEKRLLQQVENALAQGFGRIKLKIGPGHDLEPLHAIRRHFGEIPLMADANSAYSLADADHLRRLDEFSLMMVEQPLAWDDLVDHAALQRILRTPVCLDESIVDAEAARKALQLGACGVINLKLSRVGGFGEALAIHNLCRSSGPLCRSSGPWPPHEGSPTEGSLSKRVRPDCAASAEPAASAPLPSPAEHPPRAVPLWCGGMWETGIGRLHNLAISSLAGFTLPGDTAPSDWYFEEDVIDPPVEFERPGVLSVPSLCGVEGRVRRDRLERYTVRREVVRQP